MIASSVATPVTARQLGAMTRGRGTRSEESPSRMDAAWGAGKSLLLTNHVVPHFIYPSVYGTAAEKAMIMQTLDSMPLREIADATSVRMVDALNQGSGLTLGATRIAAGDISLSRYGNSMLPGVSGWTELDQLNPTLLKGTLIHEIGHTRDFRGGMFSIMTGGHSHNGVYGHGPHVTRYASTMRQEDFAESYAFHHLTQDEIRHIHPRLTETDLRAINEAKANDLEHFSQANFAERFVESHPEFRETGRYVGELLSNVPYIRLGMSMLSQVAILNYATSGIGNVFSGAVHGNGRQALTGLLNMGTAAGLAFSFRNPALGPLGLAFMGATRGLEMAGKTTAGTGGTAAAMLGGAVGGAIGGVVAPMGGVMAGYAIGGPVGGAIGLLAGGLLGYQGGSFLGAKAALALTGADKKP